MTSIRRTAAAERFFGEAGAIVCFLVEVDTLKKNEQAGFGEAADNHIYTSQNKKLSLPDWRSPAFQKYGRATISTGFSYAINKYIDMILRQCRGFSYPMNL